MSKQDEMLRHYDKLMRKAKSMDKNDAPSSCRRCPYYRPEFKYRHCLYARCPYDKHRLVFRKHPLHRDQFSGKEVVKMRV